MELRNITTFQRAAELNSFSKTAEELGYTQSAVTIQIQQLEKELGVLLFERIGKKIRLTEEGEMFLIHARKVSDSLQAAISSVSEHEQISGALRIGTSESLCSHILPDIIERYTKHYPNVQLQIETIPVTDMKDAVLKNQIDILFFVDLPAFEKNMVRGIAVPLTHHFVTTPDNELAHKTKVPLAKILSQPLILTEKGLSYRDELERYVYGRKLQFEPRITCDNADLLLKTVLRCGYVSYLPDFMTDELVKEEKLIRLPCEIPTQMQMQAVYHQHKQITPQMQAFLDLLTELE